MEYLNANKIYFDEINDEKNKNNDDEKNIE
jgi:hypothetical protein